MDEIDIKIQRLEEELNILKKQKCNKRKLDKDIGDDGVQKKFKGNNKVLSNLIIQKILAYQLEESIVNNEHFDFISSVGLVCKEWYEIFIPKLLDIQPLFKNDDYLYSYLRLRDLNKEIMNRKTKTTYQLDSDTKISNLFRSIYLPTISTGSITIDTIENPPTRRHINNYYCNPSRTVKRDYKIYIDGIKCGTIFEPDITKILELASPAKFGKGTELVYDESIRKGKSIPGNRVKVPYFELKSHDVVDRNSFKKTLSKIHIYEKGGHFDEHIDTITSHEHIGTCIIPLGVDTYKGGEFIVSENQSLDPKDESTLVYRVEANQIAQDKYEFHWISFYNDCLHKINPVTDGIRIVLQYDISYRKSRSGPSISNEYWDQGEGDDPQLETINYDRKSQYLTLNTEKFIECKRNNEVVLEQLSKELDSIMKSKNRNSGLFLNHLYKAHIDSSHLKGVDLDIWRALKNFFGEKRLKIASFLISMIDNYDDNPIIKIDTINSKTINQSFDKSTKTHTLMFCGSKYSNLKSIHSKPLPSTGNEERYYDDVGCFSAIIISNDQLDWIKNKNEPEPTKKKKKNRNDSDESD